MKDELIRYIEIEKKKGFDNYTIRKRLAESGYTEDEIYEAFAEIEKSRKAKITIIASAAAAILIVALISYLVFNAPAKYEEHVYEYTKEEVDSLYRAWDEKNALWCMEAGELSPLCYGVINLDTGQCKELKGRVRELCIMLIAKNRGDANLCKDLIVLRDSCYMTAAYAVKDKKLCDKAGILMQPCLEMDI